MDLNSKEIPTIQPPKKDLLSEQQYLRILYTLGSLIGLIGVIAVGLLLWQYATFKAPPPLSKPKVKVLSDLEMQVQMIHAWQNSDRLTLPNGGALKMYRDLQLQYPLQNYSRIGILAVGERLLRIAEQLHARKELNLMLSTLQDARLTGELIDNRAFHQHLAELDNRYTQLKLELDTRAQEADAQYPKIITELSPFRDTLSDGSLGPAMIPVPSGSFTIGSPASDLERDDDEGPQQGIDLQAFAISQTEVTFVDFDRFVNATGHRKPSDFSWGRGARPVIDVTWQDAKAYASWLSKETGYVYRLPTEAEWEYAAHAGQQSLFALGDCLLANEVNFDNREFPAAFSHCNQKQDFRGQTLTVATLPANPWGLYNLDGNVREWTEDCWQLNYLEIPLDGSPQYQANGGRCSTDDGKRVVRGGAWNAPIASGRTANRFALNEAARGSNVGIRLVRELRSKPN